MRILDYIINVLASHEECYVCMITVGLPCTKAVGNLTTCPDLPILRSTADPRIHHLTKLRQH